ncbi:MAG: MarR family transcriptional regulator [Anaerolineales bacterium]|nr:MarR family transcriptional regulator [Anaerolineales bacterium]
MNCQPEEPPRLDSLLAQVSRLHHYRARELLEGFGLHRGQPPVLFTLWEQEGLTHSELASRLQITPATITRMIQRMEKAGFVQRKPDPDDQRISRVYLTDAGRAIRSQVQAVWERMEVENFGGFSDEERVILRHFLLQIRANLTRALGGKISF